MTWGSWSAFFAMGGAGVYVWSAYGVVALALAAELGLLRARLRRARRGHDGSVGHDAAQRVATRQHSAPKPTDGGTPR